MSCIYSLPEEILEKILSSLSPYGDLEIATLVSKQWNRLVKGIIRRSRSNFNQALRSTCVSWEKHKCATSGPTIAERYSHCMCYHDKSLYVFGGCTSTNTTFNDMWRFDLRTDQWVRPLSMGIYPSPKACASLVCHRDTLLLYGGWSHPSPYPLHQAAKFFSEFHMYTPATNRWSLVQSFANILAPPPTAGHSASVVGDIMVVFGGCHSPDIGTSDLWLFDLVLLEWRFQLTSTTRPQPRYGQSQCVLGGNHIFVMGGCGGPNQIFSDAWLLEMRGEVWQWAEVKIGGAELGPPQLWCHQACRVADNMVVLGKLSKTMRSRLDEERAKTESLKRDKEARNKSSGESPQKNILKSKTRRQTQQSGTDDNAAWQVAKHKNDVFEDMQTEMVRDGCVESHVSANNRGSGGNNTGSGGNNRGSGGNNRGSGANNRGSGANNTGSGGNNRGSGGNNRGSGANNTGSGANNTGSGANNTGSGGNTRGSGANNRGISWSDADFSMDSVFLDDSGNWERVNTRTDSDASGINHGKALPAVGGRVGEEYARDVGGNSTGRVHGELPEQTGESNSRSSPHNDVSTCRRSENSPAMFAADAHSPKIESQITDSPKTSSPKKSHPSVRPNASRNRQKQLEMLQRYSDRIRQLSSEAIDRRPRSQSLSELRRSSPQQRQQQQRQQRPPEAVTRDIQSRLCLHTLDIARVVSDHEAMWLPVQRPLASDLDETVFYTLARGWGEVLMFGGMHRDLTSMLRSFDIKTHTISKALYRIRADTQA